MATLTYDPTPADQPEFTPEEQESLAIGEKAVADQEQMLAGKFKDAEALEQAYIELQKKLGESNDEDESKPAEEVRDEDETTEEVEEPEEEGEESEDDGEGGYSDEDVAYIYQIAGGEKEYDEMLQWAAGNLNKPDIEAFDHVIGLNDPQAAAFAVMALKSTYENNVGKEGKMLTGSSSRETPDVFKSQAQVVEAMSDPKYDRDPAYRQAVMEKLQRSNIQY